MKTLITSVIFLVFFCTLSQTATAQHNMVQSYPVTASEKLVNGITNAATGFVELPKTIILTSRRDGAAYGLTIGFVTGIMHTIGRTVFGVLDAATFFIPTQSTVHPSYIWQDFDKETTYGQ
ncbi:exosortase system-associated protein, TIGR04073 family [Nitrosomonas sp.]|uniref:exosortase system-associated protein, TIGR04073 family n=1 Tax=Nitrosomonas sp. TaxID=42353 RepID=UPI0025FC2AF9|nr:exosortase system-associated protein, TIGR04073 family [Nitrosomonas sp.]MCC6917399.1 exosortase system-associated protein, TIGR04073 family [Nitrosomonas sp.]